MDVEYTKDNYKCYKAIMKIISLDTMDKLITDSARVEISKRVQEILRALCIDDWQSEANYQHQNFAEHRWKFFKKNIEWFMNYRNVPGYAWLLCAKWIAAVMNHTSEHSLGGERRRLWQKLSTSSWSK